MTTFTAVSAPDPNDLEAVLQIYTDSFPLNERHPIETIGERVTRGRYRLVVGHAKDEIVFFALLWPLRGTEFVLLDYMATKSSDRGRGIAAEFLKSISEMPEMTEKFLLLEVEAPGAGENRLQRAKRVEFYRRIGARILQDVPYIMPGLSGGEPTGMILMILPGMDDNRIDGAIVRKLVTQIYKELYGRAADDGLLLSFVKEIPENVSLI